MDDIASRPCEDEAAMVLQRSNDFGATWDSSTEIPLRVSEDLSERMYHGRTQPSGKGGGSKFYKR